jgi:hypothetical protein
VFVFTVLEFELRAYTLSPSTSSFFVIFFKMGQGVVNYLPGLALNREPPDLEEIVRS